MKLIRGGLATIGLLAVAGAAQAGVTSTWTATNDYDFRGNSQSAKDPAIQASLDYAAASGWYVGAWASNIDFGVPSGGPLDNPDIELDVYGGYTKTLESGWAYDFGVVAYTYPQETDFTYEEVYASIAKDWFEAKIWYSPEFGGKGGEGSFAQPRTTAAAFRPGTSKRTRPSAAAKLLAARSRRLQHRRLLGQRVRR